MEHIISNIKKALNYLDTIISKDPFSAYLKTSDSLNNSIHCIENKNFSAAKEELLFSIRMIMEAPPEDSELALEILNIIDKSYKTLQSISPD
ncbi:MAG: hypothetical protein JNL57_01615 [Bacteroidetes bacterium]|nr:hypothetical protein [Bacteroidota bacterium]